MKLTLGVIMNTILNAGKNVLSFVFYKHWDYTWLTTSLVMLFFAITGNNGAWNILLWITMIIFAVITIAGEWENVLTFLSKQILTLITLLGKTMFGGNGLLPALFLNGAILFVGGFFYGGENGIHIAALGVVLIIGGILAIAKAPTEVLHEKIEKKFFE